MRCVFRLALALALGVGLLAAPEAVAQSRLTGFDLLRVTPSARAAALGGTFAPAPGRASADGLFYNPAFLSEEVDGRVTASVLNHLDVVWQGSVAYTHHSDRLGGTLGAAIRHLSYGEFERTTFEGTTEGTFGASETALSLSYGRPLSTWIDGALGERLHAGATVHAALVALDDANASAVAADIGLAYVVPEQNLTVSLALRNAGLVTSHLGTTDDRLPTDLRLTVSKRLENLPLRLTASAYDLTRFESETGSALNELARHLAVGGEFELGSALALRAGYDHRRREDLRTESRFDFAGASFGFGLDLRRIGFDYAYTSWSSFGGLHHLTVRARL